eukprot:CAMPEP_0119014762 /NCGR_PEP_ID=MMETSP1176-20130426/10375_1 /TAXON_ID=265551 /ORGANISM="Synedropsis recta cf, Strain CCMP1620" /LENGTH=325 /DNA_ID=CAMNT_0006968001 /DNA_START=30 /DNA_END=1007 /DNA_ORIENTATION=-
MTTMMATEIPMAGEVSQLDVFLATDDLTIEERVDKMIEDKDRRAMEAWTMMPRLFDIWDADASGTLDKNEVFLGVDQYCEAREIVFDSRVITQLWSQVDDNGDGVLDRHEFAVFLARYCEAVGVGLDDMAFVVLEQLAGVTMTDGCEELAPKAPATAWAKFAALTRKKPTKRQSWAQLKVESEMVEQTVLDRAQSNWDAMKCRLAFKNFQQAAQDEDKVKKHEAAENVWHKVDQALVSKKKRQDNAPPPAERRMSREQRKRPSAKIQASSLDGFFSSVGDVIEKNKRDRAASNKQMSLRKINIEKEEDQPESNLSALEEMPENPP